MKANVDEEIWYISEAAVDKLRMQARDVEILETFAGEKLVGYQCQLPINTIERTLLVLPAEFVDPTLYCKWYFYS